MVCIRYGDFRSTQCLFVTFLITSVLYTLYFVNSMRGKFFIYNFSFFIHLHTINDRTDNILYLCIAFENLLKQADSHLFFHLQFNIDFQPLSLAYRWILYGFVGVLSPDQVLLLWDRMIGYDTNLILSVMAAAIFSFRKSELLLAKCEKDVLVNILHV
jgi:hypothetical protein